MDRLEAAVARLAAVDAAAVARPDTQAWCLLGLRAAGENAAAGHTSRLARFQREDGSLPVVAELPQTHWPTALAALAWAGLDTPSRRAAARATGFLSGVQGKHWAGSDVLGHDPSIVGWSWISDTHSWVEPSSLAILAIARAGVDADREAATRQRVDSAVRMILNRQLPDGGWNYGNTVVLGNTLKPLPEETAMALCALREGSPQADVTASLKYLEAEQRHVRSPATLAWSILATRAWGRPMDWSAAADECLAVQDKIGLYPVDMVAQLVTACLGPSLILGDAAARPGEPAETDQ